MGNEWHRITQENELLRGLVSREILRIAQIAHTANGQSASDQRNLMEDIAEGLAAVLAAADTKLEPQA